MAFGTRVRFEAVREAAFGAITGSFTAVGTGLTDHSRIVTFNNGTNTELYVSFDGTTNNLRIAANSFKLFDFCSDKVSDDGFFVDLGTIFYVKAVGALPASGSFWIEVCYAAGGV